MLLGSNKQNEKILTMLYNALTENFKRFTTFRVAALFVGLLLGFLSFNAKAQDASVRVLYPFDNDVLNPAYLGNEQKLAELDSLMGHIQEGSVVEVLTYSSPEGNVYYNKDLSRRRAIAAVNYLESTYPSLKGRIHVTCGAESWDDLRAKVVADERLSETSRSQIISIIDADVAPDAKEASLKALPAYKTLYGRYFKQLRFAEISLQLAPELEPVVIPEDSVMVNVPMDPLAINPPVVAPIVFPAFPKELPKAKNTIVAVKTNLLFDAVTALNVEVEVPIGKRWSVMVEDVFPWWETGNKYCFQMWEMGIEGRYWFKPWESVGTDKLRGWFAGPYVMSSKYDFQYDKSINYQGEYWSAGVSAGYSLPIGKSKRNRFEFSLGLGYLNTQYRHYNPADDYSKLLRDRSKDGKLSYFGPTKAKVSLVIPINVPVKAKKGVNNE